MARLGDLFLHIRNGANIKQGLDDSGYPITRIETISNRVIDRNKMGYAGITNLEKYSDYVMQDGDILMSHINSETHLGKTALYNKLDDEIIIHGMNLLSLRPNQDLITSEYAFYYLSSQSFLRQIPNITKKSVNQASFTVSSLKELFFPVESIEEQKQISKTLDKICDLIALQKQQLTKLDELVKSRFIEMFGDPMLNTKGFQLVPYGSLFELNAGGTPSKKESKYWDGGTISWIGSNMCQNEIIYQNDGKYITEDGYNNSSARMFPIDTVLIALVGATIGKTALLKFETTTNQNVLGIRKIAESSNNPYFVFYYTQGLYNKFLEIGDGGFSMASKDFVSKLPFPIVPIDLQNEFATFVEQTDKLKLEVKKSLEKLETLKKSLMQQYFG